MADSLQGENGDGGDDGDNKAERGEFAIKTVVDGEKADDCC